MATVKRHVRRTGSSLRAFDDVHWPIDVALIVLGGFLVGTALCFLRFDDRAWYRNAWTPIIGVPLFIASGMYLTRRISRLWLKRSMQFGMLVSLLFHLVLTLALMEVTLRAKPWTDQPRPHDLVRQQEERLIPEFRTFDIAQLSRPQQEFEEPVETDEAIPLLRSEERVVVDQSPVEPQPQPVEHPEETVRPTIAKHDQSDESVPRRSEQASRLSRNRQDVRITSESAAAAAAAAPAANATAAAQPAPQNLATERQSPAAHDVAAAMPTPDIAAPQTHSLERSAATNAVPETAQNPLTVRRDAAAANITPSLDARRAPQSATVQPLEPVLSPRDTELAQRATSGSLEHTEQDAPQQALQPNATVERRQNNVNDSPVVAQTSEPLPNRQPRLTERPTEELLTQAADLPAAAAEPATSRSDLHPTEAPVPRAVVESALQPAAAQPTDARSATAATAMAERPVNDPATLDATSAEPVTAPQRSELAEQISEPQPEAAAAEQSQPRDSSGQLLAADSPLSRRSAAAAANVPADATEAAEIQPAQPAPTVTASERLATSAADANTPAPEATRPLSVSRSPTAAPQVNIDAASLAELRPSSSPSASSSSGLRPTDSSVARQPTTASAAEPSRQLAEQPSASPAQQIARNESQRLIAASEPTLNSLERPTERPNRAQNIADAPQSPANVASPASQVTASEAPALTPPSSLAVARGSAGTAGSGYSPNLDRRSPAGESPALAASGSSRERATQTDDEGPALAPISRAEVARAQADQLRPSAAMEAEGGLAGPVPAGDVQPGPAASASAAPVELSARAERGPVSADRGTLDVDIGPQRIVSQFQSGRGSGGGREMLNLDPQSPASSSEARPQRSGASEIAINSDIVAPAAAAPAGDGGARPLAIDASPAATAAQRTDAGGTNTTSGAPAVGQLEGPPSEPNAADAIGQLARRTSREMLPAAPTGGAPGTAAQAAGEPTSSRQSLAGLAPTVGAAAAPAPAAGAPAAGAAAPGSEAGLENPDNAPAAASVTVARSRPGAGRSAPAASDALPAAATGSEATSSAAAASSMLAARRSEAADAPAGADAIGGGTGRLQRQAQGPTISADPAGAALVSPGDIVATDGDPASAGPAAAGIAIAQQPGGVSAGDLAPLNESSAVTATPTGGPLRPGGPGGDVPILAQPSATAGSTRAAPRPGVSPAIDGDVAEPAAAAVSEASRATGSGSESGIPQPQLASGPRSTGSALSLPVAIDAPAGDGGLATVPDLDAGLPDRRARPNTDQIQSRIARLPRQEVGGRPQFNPSAVVAAEAFRKRVDRPGRGQGGGQLDPQSERAIELGLAFLARYQQDDGRWSLQGFDREKPSIQSDAAATALALLAFQGAGYTHLEHQYAGNVRRALDFLIANQNEDGLVFAEADDESTRVAKLYSHAICTLALCEAYGMTQDPALRQPAQQAIRYMIETQHNELGGWRYAPQVSSDTSVTGWMMMAMKSGELAGLEVPQSAYDGVLKWLEAAKASDRDPHLYRYNPYAEDAQRHGRRPSKTMTSVGLLMRLYLGWRRDNVNMQRGAEYLRQHLPTLGTANQNVLERDRDTYYWYYATQVMFHMGGDAWREWNARLHPLLVDTQIRTGKLAGSWDPLLPVPDRWAGHGGRLYVTTMNLLSMEVSYRHLPLYEDTAK